MSVVWRWKVRERRPMWLGPLAARVFAVGARTQDGGAKDHDASAQTSPGTAGGEDAAFDAFFARHEHALYGYLRRMLPTHEAALDVAQEAFLRAWRHFETIRDYDRPQAWLFRVATNLALDVVRRRQPLGITQRPGERATEASESADTDDLIGALMDPFDMERSLAERDLVNRALRRLPERQRAALLLWAAHGLTCAEIAAALETTEANARQLLSRGRARFREIYERALKDE